MAYLAAVVVMLCRSSMNVVDVLRIKKKVFWGKFAFTSAILFDNNYKGKDPITFTKAK